MADRITASRALTLNFLVQAAGVALVFPAGRATVAAVFILVYGISVAAPLALLPLLTAESLGLKRYGLLGGLVGLAQTSGAAIGPLVSGRIFDQTQSYAAAFELCIVINLIGAMAAYACRLYTAEREIADAAALPASA